MKNTIVIYVSGGVVQEVRTNAKHPPAIEIFDVDNLEEENSRKEIEKKWDKITKQHPTVLL